MSIAKQIIFSNDAAVASFLERQVKLDEIDEYGYTPLVQTAIVNSGSKAKLLLDAGADANFTDLTGRSALHWATANNNQDLAELLLHYGADANSYTRAAESVLVMPLLRRQKEMEQLLFKHRANLNFARDFINAKLLGHRFNLVGRVDIVDAKGTFVEAELEGFYFEFSLSIVVNSLLDFRNNYGGKHLRKYFNSLDIVIDCLDNALQLLRYQHYLIKAENYDNEINKLLDHEILVIPISFGGHAISFILYDDWLMRCDRGIFGREHGTVIFYRVHNKTRLNKAFIKQLIYKRQHENFINKGLIDYLGLEAELQLSLAPQESGNCSWANVEAVVPTLMFLLAGDRDEKQALRFYHSWREWDKNRALHFCLQSFYEANPARGAAKAALLAAILFQACDYQNKVDRERANKILPILAHKEYDYILKSYVEVFAKDKGNRHLANLRNFLDDYGLAI